MTIPTEHARCCRGSFRRTLVHKVVNRTWTQHLARVPPSNTCRSPSTTVRNVSIYPVCSLAQPPLWDVVLYSMDFLLPIFLDRIRFALGICHPHSIARLQQLFDPSRFSQRSSGPRSTRPVQDVSSPRGPVPPGLPTMKFSTHGVPKSTAAASQRQEETSSATLRNQYEILAPNKPSVVWSPICTNWP